MSIIHRMTGYDKRTERLASEYDVPSHLVDKARGIAKVAEVSDGFGSYPLDAAQAQAIALLADATIDVDRYDWFLEPFQGSNDMQPVANADPRAR